MHYGSILWGGVGGKWLHLGNITSNIKQTLLTYGGRFLGVCVCDHCQESEPPEKTGRGV